MSENSKRPVTVRFDKEVHDRLQQMSQDSGESITELVRNLVERALEKNTHTELLVQTQALTRRVAQIEQMVGHALPTLHQRLAGIEQLICSADANAAQRDALDFARHYNLFSSTRYGIWELQTIIVHVLEYAMLTHGNSREVAYKFHADCQDASSKGFEAFRGHGRAGHRRDRCRRTRTAAATASSRAGLRPAARAAGQHTRSG